MVETKINLPTVVEANVQSHSVHVFNEGLFKQKTSVAENLNITGDMTCSKSVGVLNAAYFASELSLLGKLNLSFNNLLNIPNPIDSGDAVNASTLRKLVFPEFIHSTGFGDFLWNRGNWCPWKALQNAFWSSGDYLSYFKIDGHYITIFQPGLYTVSVTVSKQGAYVLGNGAGTSIAILYGSRTIGALSCESTGSNNYPAACLNATFYVAPSEVNQSLTLQPISDGWFYMAILNWTVMRYTVL